MEKIVLSDVTDAFYERSKKDKTLGKKGFIMPNCYPRYSILYNGKSIAQIESMVNGSGFYLVINKLLKNNKQEASKLLEYLSSKDFTNDIDEIIKKRGYEANGERMLVHSLDKANNGETVPFLSFSDNYSQMFFVKGMNYNNFLNVAKVMDKHISEMVEVENQIQKEIKNPKDISKDYFY